MSSASSAERVRRHRLKKKLSAEAGGTMLFTRPDWSLFLDPGRLPQKAGCDAGQVRAVALKELVDNALDAGANATLERVDADTWTVADDGAGLDAAAIATLFAVDRPLTSSKLLRRPTRGAVGNGLRVVTGAAIASGGALEVESRGRRFRIEVDRQTGGTEATELRCDAAGRSKVTKPGTEAGCNAAGRSGTR
jgi:Histidine kinase-, DNA gyrase B-, and HSP90-like ATPase